MSRPTPSYEIEAREVLADAPGLRVSILTLAPGQEVPWHKHTTITDTFVCMSGSLRIETREPRAEHVLEPGQRHAVPAGEAHRVTGLGMGAAKFLVIQGVGEYDYVALEA